MCFEKVGFDDSFIQWIKILLNDQQSCVINAGVSTQYSSLKRGARQRDPISAYLFYYRLRSSFCFD